MFGKQEGEGIRTRLPTLERKLLSQSQNIEMRRGAAGVTETTSRDITQTMCAM